MRSQGIFDELPNRRALEVCLTSSLHYLLRATCCFIKMGKVSKMFVSVFFIMLCIKSSFSEPIEPIVHSPGMYFDPTSDVYFYNDYCNVITHIEFIPIKPYLDKIEKSLSDISVTCNKFQYSPSLHIDCNDTVNPLVILINANNLKYNSLSQLVSANEPHKQTTRSKRGLFNFVGTVNKFLFGTLDADDAQRYDEALAAVSQNEEQRYSYMKENILVLRSTINAFNDSITKLDENEKNINEQLQKLNKMFINNIKDTDNLKNAARIDSIFNLIESSLMSVSNILDTVLNSILFAKMNILHPYVLTPTNLYNELIQNQIVIFPNIQLSLQNIHNIIDISKLISYVYKNKLVFVLQIPLIRSDKYNLYKNLPLPTPRVENNLDMYVLIHPTKLYTAITDDKRSYALLDSVSDCQDFNSKLSICPLPSILSVNENPSCESDLLTKVIHSLPKMCDSRVIYGNINVWQKLNDGRYIYIQSKPNRLSIECAKNNQKNRDYTIQGTGILTLEDDCVAYFQNLQFKPSVTYKMNLPNQLKIDFDIIEDDCCKFKLVNSSTHMLTPITLNDVNLESLKSASDKLDQMEMHMQQAESVPHIVKYGSYYSTFTNIIIVVIVAFIIYTVFIKCRNSSAAPVILHQRFP